MHGCGSRSGRISVSRCNRRLHQLADWMAWIPDVVGEVVTTGDGFLIESLPLPVCRRVRARRWRTVRGRACCGYCAAKRETFVGWRVHLVCRPDGVPVRVQMLPAGMHDLTTPPPPRARGGLGGGAYGLPAGARLLGDKAYNSAADEASILAETGVRLVPVRRATMRPHAWFRCAGRPCVRTPGVWTTSNCVRIVIRLRRSTVNWRRWALSGFTHVPMPGLN